MTVYDPDIEAAYYDPDIEAAYEQGRADMVRSRLRSNLSGSKAMVAALVGFFGFWLAYVVGRWLLSAVLGGQLHGVNVFFREELNNLTGGHVHGVGLLHWPDSAFKSLVVFVLVLAGMIAAARLAFNREKAPTSVDRASARPTPRVVLTLLILAILAALVTVVSSGEGKGGTQPQIHPTSASEVKVLAGQEASAKAKLDEANSKVKSAEATLANAMVALSQANALHNAKAMKLATQAIAQAKVARSSATAERAKAAENFSLAHKRVTDAQLGNCPKGQQPSGNPKDPCKTGTSSGSQ